MKRFAIVFFLITLAAHGAEMAGVKMADTVSIGGKNLVLNGLGIRKATFLKVKVYVGGLYLEAKSGNSDEILKSKTIKHLSMKYVRDVSDSKIQGAFNESFEKSCGDKCAALKPKLEELAKAMPSMKEGGVMEFTFFPDHVDGIVNGEKKVTIADAAFPEIFLSIWLGANPPNEDLKTGLLGKM